ncbi:MAG TPA: hypothetical protein DCM62_10625 [Bacteroidales bacterium]|nr:hypothetical protein [Bacteroidales bacterium]
MMPILFQLLKPNFLAHRVGWSKGLILAAFMLMAYLPSAANPKATIAIAPDSIKIGEQFTIDIQLHLPPTQVAVWPLLVQDFAANIEILSLQPIDTTNSSGNRVLSQTLIATSFASGFHPIPPVVFTIIENQDTMEVETEAMLVSVQDIAIQEGDTPYDVKPILSMPWSFREIASVVIPVLLGIMVLYYIIKKFRDTIALRKNHKLQNPKPELPAHVEALKNLERLQQKKLWQSGKVKLYYIELTYILRHYLERRFAIKALEITTDETLALLSGLMHEQHLLIMIENLLRTADLAKFAKLQPDGSTNDVCMANAILFVKSTAQETVEPNAVNGVEGTSDSELNPQTKTEA